MDLVLESPQRPPIALWMRVQIPTLKEFRVNINNGKNGPSAQLLVARVLKSGLELAVEVEDLVQESPQR